MSDQPKGYECWCGQFHEFHPWVYAHWTILLTHTCMECGSHYEVLEGEATLLTAGSIEAKGINDD